MRANTCRHCRERNSNSQSGRSRLKRCWRGTAKPAPSVLLAADQKVVHLLARSKLRRQPAGLLAATGPSLGRIFRVPVSGKDLRVRTALAVRGDNLADRSELVTAPQVWPSSSTIREPVSRLPVHGVATGHRCPSISNRCFHSKLTWIFPADGHWRNFALSQSNLILFRQG